MDYNQLLEELKKAENETENIECKSSFKAEELGRTMASFSTKKGGYVFLGINPNYEPIGVLCNKDLHDNILQVARTCSPPAMVNVETIPHDKEKKIVCIKVEKGNGEIYSYKNVFYERRQGINHPLNAEEILELKKRSKKLYFDEMPAKSFERPGLVTDIDQNKVKDYLQTSRLKNIPAQFDLKQFLINNELTINSSAKVRNAAVMLFGRNPQQFVPHLRITISIFPSDEITEQFIKKEIKGDVVDVLIRTFTEVERNIRVFSFVDGLKRIDVPEYPPEALREAIVNAMAHRDYFIDNSEIFVRIFKSRIEIMNPGGFPYNNMNFEEIERSGLSIRRNPKIAEFLEKMSLMEKAGRGIKRIKTVTQNHGLPTPTIEASANTFKIIFYGVGQNHNKLLDSPYGRTIDKGKMNERQLQLVNYLKREGSVSRGEYCQIFGVPQRTASRDLNDLVKMRVIQRAGFKKGARYYLIS